MQHESAWTAFLRLGSFAPAAVFSEALQSDANGKQCTNSNRLGGYMATKTHDSDHGNPRQDYANKQDCYEKAAA